MTLHEQWQISGSGPDNYERFAVGRHMRPIAERLLAQVPLRPGDRVLDVACGTGIVTRLAAARVAASGRAVGLDLNEEMLTTARRLGAEAGVDVDFRQGDATRMPFAEGEFDVVLCQQGLQFIPDKSRALGEMRRVLVAGGRYAINVFGRASLFHAALSEGLAKYVDASVAELSLAPFALGDATALRALVREAGFREISISSESISRRVEPTQEWLLQYSSALPYGASIAAMDPPTRAAMLREMATRMKDLWAGDSFCVPCEVHFVFARG